MPTLLTAMSAVINACWYVSIWFLNVWYYNSVNKLWSYMNLLWPSSHRWHHLASADWIGVILSDVCISSLILQLSGCLCMCLYFFYSHEVKTIFWNNVVCACTKNYGKNVCSQLVPVNWSVCVCMCACLWTCSWEGDRGSWELWEQDNVASDKRKRRVTDRGEIAWERMWGCSHPFSPLAPPTPDTHTLFLPLLSHVV